MSATPSPEYMDELRAEEARILDRIERLHEEARRLRVRIQRDVNTLEAAGLLTAPSQAFPVIASTHGVWPARMVVYGLVDELEPDRVRYIGQSTLPEWRFVGHCTSRTGAVGEWVATVKAAGSHVLMRFISRHDSQPDLDRAERAAIEEYRSRGMADLNGTPRSAT